jgi:hypothetical protein
MVKIYNMTVRAYSFQETKLLNTNMASDSSARDRIQIISLYYNLA